MKKAVISLSGISVGELTQLEDCVSSARVKSAQEIFPRTHINPSLVELVEIEEDIRRDRDGTYDLKLIVKLEIECKDKRLYLAPMSVLASIFKAIGVPDEEKILSLED